jgi:hypothetical protein
MIKNIELSNRKNKRFMITINNGHKKIHFGDKNGNTFIDHNNEEKRINYFNRHYNNFNERKFIDEMIISPSMLSLFILWGPYIDINDNLKLLNYVLIKKLDFNKNMILTKKYDKKINNYFNNKI